jgi:iron complex outermembrane receptor protein
MNKKVLFFTFLASTLALQAWGQGDTIRLEEVVVTGTRALVNKNNVPMTISVIGRQEIEESGESALLRVLSGRVPGMFVTERGVVGFGVGSAGAGTVSLRGVGGGNGLLILIDGHPQYMGIMGHHLPDAHVASDAGRVEVIRGPASLLYGSNAMGGVINIITRGQEKEGWSGSGRLAIGSYNTREYRANAGWKGGKWDAFLSVNRDRTDGHRDDKSARFDITSGYVKLGYRLSDRVRAWGDASLAAYEVKDPGREDDPKFDNLSDILRGVLSVTLENTGGKSHGALKFFYNFGRHDINDGFYGPGSTEAQKGPRDYLFRSRDHHYGVTLYQIVRPFRGNTITAGVDFKNFGGRAWDDFLAAGTPDNVHVDTSLHELAGYLVVQQTLLDKWTLTAGARLERSEQFGLEWVPQAGIAFRPSRDGVLKASVSRGFRGPNIRELFYKAAWAGASPDLLPERMVSYELSAGQLFLRGRLSVELAGFIASARNLIVADWSGGFPPVNRNTGKLASRGVEVAARWDLLEGLRVEGNYSYLHLEEPVPNAPGQQLNLSASYRRHRWAFGARYRRVRDLYITTSVKEHFGLLSARASYRPLAWLDLFARGENLGGARYSIIEGYPMPGATVTGGVNVTF